ncbi:alpha/beta hydrolase [Paenibacillus sp. FSL K6-1096]|uniref:alpha/beta fold hydrolase n=1 Tax=Paenibacillus sp. FSL K6-1096 TaxID=2921460 RepID=UPI0030EDBE25
MIYSKYAGRGTPSVVFVAGLGDGSDTWNGVQERISQETSTFTYDRPGTGRSQAVPGPRSCADLVEELSGLLQKLNILPPYILVGHSFGGLVARLFAARYPELVLGMVLIDAAVEYKELAYERVLHDKLVVHNREYYLNPLMNKESIDKPRSYMQVAELTQISDLNISIIMRGLPDTYNEEWPNEAILRIDQEMQAEVQKLYPSSQCRIAAGSRHYIHQDEPEIVIEEIMAMIKGRA